MDKTFELISLHILFGEVYFFGGPIKEKRYTTNLVKAGFTFLDRLPPGQRVGTAECSLSQASIHLLALAWFGPYEGKIIRDIFAKHHELKNVIFLSSIGMGKRFNDGLIRDGATAVLVEPDPPWWHRKDMARLIRELNGIYKRLERRRNG